MHICITRIYLLVQTDRETDKDRERSYMGMEIMGQFRLPIFFLFFGLFIYVILLMGTWCSSWPYPLMHSYFKLWTFEKETQGCFWGIIVHAGWASFIILLALLRNNSGPRALSWRVGGTSIHHWRRCSDPFVICIILLSKVESNWRGNEIISLATDTLSFSDIYLLVEILYVFLHDVKHKPTIFGSRLD